MKASTTVLTQPIASGRSADYLDKRPQYPALIDPLIEIVVPVYNEQHILRRSIKKLDHYLQEHFPYRYTITIADNGSSDSTQVIARQLSRAVPAVSTIRLPQKGRGRALKAVWHDSKADIVSYMDVDLSTSLDDFLPLITPLVSGHAGVAIGSRLHTTSETTRSWKREIISRTYNAIIRLTSKISFRDAQCGYKALRKEAITKLLPRIKDDEWFFDTELLIKAERSGVRIHEQPVTWIEDSDSRVKIVRTAFDDLRGLVRVNAELDGRPLYQKLALPLLLLASGALYLFGALHNGMANSYYAAAVQAASQDWTAWLYGSLDAANYISIDKPPFATMLMGLSARIIGFSSFSMLLPSVLAGVGSVWLVYAAVKRQFGWRSGMIGGVTMAITPVAALMFGFNNPDGILTLLLAASGYTFLRSLEQKNPLLWLSLAGLFTGLAFNTKMLQGLMVVPAMALVYLVFAKPRIATRLLHLAVAGIVTTVSTLWWSVLVWLTPAVSRPWVGSTSDNSIWSLIFGYNGFGRLLGTGMGPGGGMVGGTPPGGSQMAGGMIGGMRGGGGGPGGSGFGGETGLLRIFNSDFGPNIGWLLAAALLGGGLMLWILRKTPRDNRGRAAVIFWLLWLLTHIVIFSMTSGVIHPYYVVVMAPAVAALVGISLPFLWAAYKKRRAYAIMLPVIVGLTTAISIMLINYQTTLSGLVWSVGITGAAAVICLLLGLYVPKKQLQYAGASLGIITGLLAPLSYTLMTVNQTHTGSIPTAGPSSTAMAGSNNEQAVADSTLLSYLLAHQGDATWLVAVASANESAAIQLTSSQPVMAVGGFNGSDTALTVAQLKALVSSGQLQYYAISARGTRGGPGGGNTEITQWVQQHGTKVNYGGSDVTLYKLSV